MTIDEEYANDPVFDCRQDPANPGWVTWNMRDSTRYNSQVLGPLLLRREPDGSARLRMRPERRHSNLVDNLHGGALLGLADVALFAAARLYGLANVGPASTIELSMQFLAGATLDAPVDAVGQVLRDTRRMMFLRGLIEQDGTIIAAFSGLIRKPAAVR